MSNVRKTLIWAIATLAFTRGFRIPEPLLRERQTYDSFVTLMGKDPVLKENDKFPHIQILLKIQGGKDRIGKDEDVDVFGTKNFFLPNQSLQKYQKSTSKLSFAAHKPTFRTKDGKTYSGKMFNADLKA